MKYFKHETSDRNKIHARLIRSRFGAAGYGIYNALLEVIGEEIDKHNPQEWGCVNELHDIETLAQECATNPDTLREFLQFCDEKKIFSKQNGRLYSSLILERTDEYTAKILRESGPTPDKVQTKTDLVRSNRIEENRIEENRSDVASPEIKEPKQVLGVDVSGTLTPKKSGISTPWQDKAFRFAEYLRIELDSSLKSRWLKFFKENERNAKVDSTVSYLVDYAPFKQLEGNKERMLYFFEVFYGKRGAKTGNISLVMLMIVAAFLFMVGPVLIQKPKPIVVYGLEPQIKVDRVATKEGELKAPDYPRDRSVEVQAKIEEVSTRMFGGHAESFKSLVFKESGFNPYAQNGSSGACGLPQAMPCSKMNCELGDVNCQVEWMASYIERRYGNPTNALTHWESRQPINGVDVGHWY